MSKTISVQPLLPMPKPPTDSKIKKVALNHLVHRQEAWAGNMEREPDYPDYTLHLEDNLFQRGLSPQTKADFKKGTGGEFNRRYQKREKTAPPKFTALKSSSALVCNVFDYWRNRGEGLLCQALNCAPHQRVAMEIEAQFYNGVSSRPCNLDVALTSNDGWVLAIEGKFTEPLGRKTPLKPAYLPPEPEPTPWLEEGLANCDKIARKMERDHSAFIYIDAPQLLKHILGLHRTLNKRIEEGVPVRDRYRLLYLYYDIEGHAGDEHRKEVEEFKRAVDGEIDFDSMTYQALAMKLRALSKNDAHRPYFDYLKARYELG